ncbi:MAG: DUF4407 domain-containing protein [Mycobacterium sp.]
MSDRRFSFAVSWPRALAYAIAAVVAGVVVGELAAMLIFAGSSDRRLDEEAMRSANSTPAVVAASNDLEQARQARSALDEAVVEASRERDEALVIARCEFSAAPQCPQSHITGVAGAGPEHLTADAFLADRQRELDRVESERARLAPALDSTVADSERELTAARDAAIASADRGFGATWTAMNAHTLASPGATVLRAVTVGLFVVLFLFALILRLSRAKNSEDRRAAARAEREQADLKADTAIAVKQAEVRAAVETMWAEHELASARLAVAAQTEIDREEQRRRVVTALDAPTPVSSERVTEVVAELPAAVEAQPSIEAPSEHLPAVEAHPEKRSAMPTMPDVAGAAMRWVRPFVPPIVAAAIDTTTKPLRAVRQVFEETEEIHISVRRSHKIIVTSEETAEPEEQWIEAARVEPAADTTKALDGPKRLARSTTRSDRRQLPSSDR